MDTRMEDLHRALPLPKMFHVRVRAPLPSWLTCTCCHRPRSTEVLLPLPEAAAPSSLPTTRRLTCWWNTFPSSSPKTAKSPRTSPAMVGRALCTARAQLYSDLEDASCGHHEVGSAPLSKTAVQHRNGWRAPFKGSVHLMQRAAGVVCVPHCP